MSEDRSGTRPRLVNVFVGMVAITVVVTAFFASPFSHKSSRRSACINNQRNLSTAILQYESAKRKMPWYASRLQGRDVSAVVPLLPYLGRNDLYELWQTANDPTADLDVLLPLLTCPSKDFSPHDRSWLSYAFNSGEATTEDKANGVFFDGTIGNPISTDLAYIARRDGLSGTVLFAENLQAEKWIIDTAPKARLWTTVVWHAAQPIRAEWRINSPATSTPIVDLTFARPSSNHPNGAVIAFCDGSVRFLDDDIDYDVYRQLMTPDGANSRDPVNRAIKDGDY